MEKKNDWVPQRVQEKQLFGIFGDGFFSKQIAHEYFRWSLQWKVQESQFLIKETIKPFLHQTKWPSYPESNRIWVLVYGKRHLLPPK